MHAETRGWIASDTGCAEGRALPGISRNRLRTAKRNATRETVRRAVCLASKFKALRLNVLKTLIYCSLNVEGQEHSLERLTLPRRHGSKQFIWVLEQATGAPFPRDLVECFNDDMGPVFRNA